MTTIQIFANPIGKIRDVLHRSVNGKVEVFAEEDTLHVIIDSLNSGTFYYTVPALYTKFSTGTTASQIAKQVLEQYKRDLLKIEFKRKF